MTSTLVRIKVIIVGDLGVGKTAIGVRAAKNIFDDNYLPTIGASFVQKNVQVGEKTIIFQIWDTAGQERFRSLVPMYLRESKIAFLVYDITSRASFLNVPSWLDELNNNAPKEIVKVLVGNKEDLNNVRQINKAEAQRLAERHGFMFFETSARTGYNIDTLFNNLANLVCSKLDTADERHPGIDLSSEHTKKKSCCL